MGSIAIQLAKKLARLKVVATASRLKSAAWVRELGADIVVDHSKDLAPQLEAAGVKEVDYIFCLNNTDRWFPAFAPIISAPRMASTSSMIPWAGAVGSPNRLPRTAT